ncbi:MAG: 30S ribosomal protein S3 [Gammaproteobacteria bacterium]|nr:30S ribosomal protein S3 [Gammaproteobacteria bacterium]
MGQKIHPTGFRLSVTRDWTSRWYATTKLFPQMLKEDIEVRDFLKKKLAHASVGRVVIERPAKNARVTVYSARPGVVIGKKGEDIEHLKGDLQRRLGVPVHVNIEEIRKPETDAQLIADSIAQQLEKRIMFRRAMKRAMQNAMRLGAQGIKIMSAGRLNGAEIARTEWYREGRVPLHTLRADIDYGTAEAKTTYGIIGIKVWVFKGEMAAKNGQPAQAPEIPAEEPVRRPRRGAGPVHGEGEGAAKPVAKRAGTRKPAAAAKAVGQEEAKPESAAPATEPAKPAVKRVRKTVAKPDAGTEGKE